MGQVIFVTWRESIEALLVIAILYTWINNNPEAQRGKKYLYGGIVAGLGLAVLLALAIAGVATFLGNRAHTIFEICILLFASFLIVQMVLWMKEHARTMKRELEDGLRKSVETSHWWGIFFLAMIAVGREGSETVVFLSGSFTSLQGFGAYVNFFISFFVGFGLALFTFYLLQASSRWISWKYFFKITEILLLFLGFSLFLQAVEKLIGGPLASVNFPNWFYGTAWNTSAILNDNSSVGSLFSSIFGYRSSPVWYDVIAFVVYWIIVLGLLSWKKHSLAKRA